ncbi:MAG: metalloregulator ArsR/SmtB family transcription factor [Alphaproteobacteria bacterium]|nr:metalloregulator ArsR/SmtB family transcription factor [Alphaproteobacteria bacterium]MCW5744019.1 metalloregulator ArsR/SmtB family transcription factor [Alphaproteobacteria bacterium]
MESTDASRGFAALAQETRLGLMRLLASRGASGMAAGELAATLGQVPSTLSFHLAQLEQAGLVQSTRQGRQIIYAVRFAGLRALFGFLTETCCGGRPELCGDLARLLPDDDQEDRRMTAAYNVLFLCTRNSARSLIAQALLEQLGKDRFNAYSAGSEPADAPMPEVIERLRTLGHPVGHLRCKSWEEFARPDAPRMDFVITLCDVLQGQDCPDMGTRPVTSAWPLPDPAKFSGSAAEHATMINALYAMIRRRLEIFINLPIASLDEMALKKRLDELGDTARAPA